MVEIKVRLQINTSQERVWDIISNIDNDSNFWRGITSIRNLSRDGNVTTREIVLGTNIRCVQRLAIYPKEEISIRWIKGVIAGTKTILLTPLGQATLLEIQMNYRFSDISNLASKRLSALFQNEAELAVDLIKKQSEWSENNISAEIKKSWAM
ncbi:MAG: SRPBCC family protein [Thaumarchaeota archaeon]|nr:SRPBCC family protein [Nitrososphaerota archaeon]